MQRQKKIIIPCEIRISICSRTRLIRLRIIRLILHSFFGPGKIPIICVLFRLFNSSSTYSLIRLIRHDFYPRKGFVRQIRHFKFCFQCFKELVKSKMCKLKKINDLQI